jgi:hypothetical protein
MGAVAGSLRAARVLVVRPRAAQMRPAASVGVASLEEERILAEPSPVVCARVRATWAFRTRAEIEASARFARMANELAEIGAAQVVVQGVLDAAADEVRHRDLCAHLAAKWGEPNATNHVPPRARIGRADMDRRDRLLWEMVSVCCLGETMNTALLTRCLEVAKEPEIRGTLRELLKDEIRHARVGWAHLAAERAAGRGAFLRDVLPLMLEASIEPGFWDAEQAGPSLELLHEYGELSPAELVQLYVETLEQVVFLGLDALGVDTAQGRDWLLGASAHPAVSEQIPASGRPK